MTSFAFGIASNAIGLPGVLGLFAGALLLAALVTLVIPETKGRTLEEIEVGDIYRRKMGSDTEATDGGTSANMVTSIDEMMVKSGAGMGSGY